MKTRFIRGMNWRTGIIAVPLSPTYQDPRFIPLHSAHAAAWQHPTAIVNSVLGQGHPPGPISFVDDPDVDGLCAVPQRDYHEGLSSPIVLARSIAPKKLEFILGGDERVYLFDGLSLQVHRCFFVEHAFLLVGVVECGD